MHNAPATVEMLTAGCEMRRRAMANGVRTTSTVATPASMPLAGPVRPVSRAEPMATATPPRTRMAARACSLAATPDVRNAYRRVPPNRIGVGIGNGATSSSATTRIEMTISSRTRG
jgi:hypothetical protein